MAIGFGSWRGLPELSITEFFGGKKGSVQTARKYPINRTTANQIATQAVSPYNTTGSNLLSRSNTPSTSVTTGGGVPRNTTPNVMPRETDRSTPESIDESARRLRGDISSGWDNYVRSLDSQLSGLSGQRLAQESMANSQYQQGLGSLNLQREQGLQSLGQNRTSAEQNQTRSLRDVSENIRNAFMAGNIFLGSRGAGDSSAADQYSYALNKMGTQQRSGVMNETANILADINARETNLNNIYNTEVNNLSEAKNQQVQQIAMWFNDAQNQLASLKSQGQLGKSQDLQALSKSLLDQAIQSLNDINQQAVTKKQALDTWAMRVSDNISTLKSTMQQVSEISPNLPQATDIFGQPVVAQGNRNAYAYNYGGEDERDRNNLFG